MSRPRFALVLVLALVATGARALAALGGRPPPLAPADWIGAPLEWDAERGRVVVLLFVEPENVPSKQAVTDLVGLADASDLARKGLRACLVTQSAKAAFQSYISRQKVPGSFSVAIDAAATIRTHFGTTETPFAAVIDRDGKIVWEGNAVADRIAYAEAVRSALAKPRTVPRHSTTPRFEPAWKAIEKKETRAAIAELVKILEAEDATPAEMADAEALLDRYRAEAAKKIAAARVADGQQDYAGALAGYDELATTYEGLSEAAEARDRAAALRKDRKLKKEIDAAEALIAARALEAAGDTKKALSEYKKIVSKWEGTRAADAAKKAAHDLEKKSK